MSVAHVREQPVDALLLRQAEEGTIARGGQHHSFDGRRGLLTVAAGIGVTGHIQPQIPTVLERITVRIRSVQLATQHSAGGQNRGPVGSAVLRADMDRRSTEARAAVGRPVPAPEIGHDVHRFGPAAILQKHAVPGMGLLVVLRPVEDVGAQALGPALDGMLVGLAIEIGLLLAGLLDGQIPRRARRQPVAAISSSRCTAPTAPFTKYGLPFRINLKPLPWRTIFTCGGPASAVAAVRRNRYENRYRIDLHMIEDSL